jgi:hypothetical protein
VEEQTATASEIGRGVAEAARGSSEIAQNIGPVARAARDTSQAVGHTLLAGEQLARMAAGLEQLIGQFTHDRDAAAAVPPAERGRPEARPPARSAPRQLAGVS